MAAVGGLTRPERIPPAADGIQVNFCKNPVCANYGVEPLAAIRRGGAAKGPHDGYRAVSVGMNVPGLLCLLCNETPTVKSNLAISEERDRMLREMTRTQASGCPDPECANHLVPAEGAGLKSYQRFGKTSTGSLRFRCKACRHLFSIPQIATTRQRAADKNEMIFKLLVNKSPMRRICKVMEIGPETLYQRIGFFYDQCIAFAASKEIRLLHGMAIRRLNVSIDRQDYLINWSSQADRRNVTLHAVASADNESGFVFGIHLDFDHTMDADAVEADAAIVGDQKIAHAFRRYSRVWLQADYRDAVRGVKARRRERRASVRLVGVVRDVQDAYVEIEARNDVEVGVLPDIHTQLPKHGMQVHSEYTLYGHFFFLARLLRGVEKVRFFLDQESGIRAACLAAFQKRIKAREVDAFYVRINKDMTVNEKRKAKTISEEALEKARHRFPSLPDDHLQVELIKERLVAMAPIGKWSDRWLLHPISTMSEPDKAVCYLTDYGDYAPDRLAWLYKRASLHAIDRFFMQIRRGINLLERPIKTASSEGRTWHGYSPYSPAVT
ncbi:MAG: transposase, partial [Panacagrimonas sp.]